MRVVGPGIPQSCTRAVEAQRTPRVVAHWGAIQKPPRSLHRPQFFISHRRNHAAGPRHAQPRDAQHPARRLRPGAGAAGGLRPLQDATAGDRAPPACAGNDFALLQAPPCRRCRRHHSTRALHAPAPPVPAAGRRHLGAAQDTRLCTPIHHTSYTSPTRRAAPRCGGASPRRRMLRWWPAAPPQWQVPTWREPTVSPSPAWRAALRTPAWPPFRTELPTC